MHETIVGHVSTSFGWVIQIENKNLLFSLQYGHCGGREYEFAEFKSASNTEFCSNT